MTERRKQSTRGERHSLDENVEQLHKTVSSFWSPALSADRLSDMLIGWNEKAVEQMKSSRAIGSAFGALAHRQSRLFMEFAQAFELDATAGGAPRTASMKMNPDKVDHIFDEASDILREASQIMSEAQVNALNWLRPSMIEGNPTPVATVEDRDAA